MEWLWRSLAAGIAATQHKAARLGASSAGPVEPVLAIDRELPSLRIDLRLTAQQEVLFDGLQRHVRDAADAGRTRARHISALRSDDTDPITAEMVLRTIAEDDDERAGAMRQALDSVNALAAALTPEQHDHLNRRIIQSLRDPLGNS